jgi:hypothetical protein
MSRRSTPERLDAAWHAGVRNRLIGDGATPETARHTGGWLHGDRPAIGRLGRIRIRLAVGCSSVRNALG